MYINTTIILVYREETGESLAKTDYEHQKKVYSLAQKSHEMIQSCKANTRSQCSKTVDRKKIEYKYMKETLSNSAATFRSILYEENEMRKLKRDHTITELDPCTSSKVEIPAPLTQKLKGAKRLQFILIYFIAYTIYIYIHTDRQTKHTYIHIHTEQYILTYIHTYIHTHTQTIQYCK